MPTERKPIDFFAMALMVVLCMSWGFQQVTIKLAAEGVSLVMQAGLRSLIATLMILVWARLRGIALFDRDQTLASGVLAGTLFAVEFLFLYLGLAYTTASRMIVFLYLAPCLTAIGLHLMAPGEQLRTRQWAGVALAFFGLFLGFAEGFGSAGGTLLGDAFGVIAAVLWAATTVVVRASRLARVSATKTLFYQIAISALMLPIVSVLIGEPGITALTPRVMLSLAYQGVVVAFVSYLVWFWLLTRYLAARLTVFAFLTPFFGVGFGVAVLNETVSPTFISSAFLVGAGIFLVNLGRY